MTLTSAVKDQLRQEHARLHQERDRLAQTVTSQTVLAIDQLVQQIDRLLGVPTRIEPTPKAQSAQPKSKPSSTAKPSQPAPKSTELAGFDAAKTKPAFQSSKLMDAVVKAIKPKQSKSIDQLLEDLYDPFDAADLKKARMSVEIAANHAVRRGLLQKIQGKPDRFARA
ncbi:hypothetical protein ACQ4M3_38985 [Leptolyngbya sp. AN03gr2]|uniref:hypothetical protein n=1 Tax=unclassified Leptolyngbya TaxID=2650499 RepID=UPI003D315BA9